MTCGGFYFGRDAVWFRVMRRWLFPSRRARDAQRLPGAEPRLVHTTRCDFGVFYHYITSVRGSRGFSGVWDRGEQPPRWVFGPQRAPARSAPRTAAAAEPGAETAPEIKLAGWSQPGGVWGVLDFWAQGRVWGDPYPKLEAPKVFRDAAGLDRDLPPGPPRSRGEGGAFPQQFWGESQPFHGAATHPSANQPSTISRCFLPPRAPVELL